MTVVLVSKGTLRPKIILKCHYHFHDKAQWTQIPIIVSFENNHPNNGRPVDRD